ncbi:MAG TPA: hypothetical protein VN408_28985 [Actinoplanes sp.]|nr:hypothetical protein [Actinoplanes sp.]
MNRWWLWVAAVLGVVLLLAAGWKTYFSADPGTALIVLVVAGALLVMSPVLAPRLAAIAVSVDGFELRLVQEIAEQGAPNTARLLDKTEPAELAQVYGLVNAHLAGEDFKAARARVQDQLVVRAAAFARAHTFDPDEVRRIFPKANAAIRVLLLGLMQGDPRLTDAKTLVSANEQYHALKLAEKHWGLFTEAEKVSLLASIDGANLGTPNNDRRGVAARIRGL